MKRILSVKSIIGFALFAFIFSFTMFATVTSADAASSTANVTHVEVDGHGNGLGTLKEESFSYPIGTSYKSYMTRFDGYQISGISESSISVGGRERVVAKIEWQKVETKEEQKTEEIPYETTEKEDHTLDEGKTVVEQEGVVGEKTVTYEVNYIGGIERNRSILSENITVEPTNEIVRVGTKVTEEIEEQETEKVPYETIEKKDPTLDEGKTVVDQAGEAGEKTITYKVTYVNGEEVNREVVSEEVTVDPIDEIILVGTKVTELKEEQETKEIPYETIEKEDSNIEYGKTVVDQAGEAGEKTITYKVTYVNGEEVKREVVSEEVTVDSVDEIILIGTKGLELKEEQETKEISYETIEKKDPTLEKGEKVVDQVGVVGEKTITYKITYVNGEEVDREIVGEEITLEPKEEIIRIGTKVIESEEDTETGNGESEGSEEDTETGNGESEGSKEDTETGNGGSEGSEEDEEDSDLIGAVVGTGADKGEGTPTSVEEDTSNANESNQLPNTATSIFNWLIGGFIALILGVVGIFTVRKRTVKIQ